MGVKVSIKLMVWWIVYCFVNSLVFAQDITSQEASAKTTQEALKEEKQERISLDLKGVDILELFKMLSLKTGLTIIPSKNVSGRVNLFLNNLTFDDALEVILISQDLAYDRKADIITVMTAAEYEKLFGEKFIEKRKFKSIKLRYAKPASVFSAISQLKSDIGKIIADEASGTILLTDTPKKLALMEEAVRQLDQPLETVILEFDYAQSEDIKSYLEQLVTADVGSMIVDERSNKAMVTDLPEKINEIRAMVKAFDEASPQVLIEAKIVQVSLSDKYQRGIEWEKIFRQRELDSLDLVGKFPVSPALSAYQKISIGTLSGDDYNLVLDLLTTYGETKILSQPRILAVNNQEAKILVGAREAYITETISQAEATTEIAEQIEFIDVGVKLNVVPTIGKDGFIVMKIKPEVSSVRETLETAAGSQVPIVETSEVETVVKVKDGTMIMIAGLLKEQEAVDVKGTPVLSDLPVVGALFSSRTTEPKKSELVIFLTPHLISGDISIEEDISKVND